MNSNIPSCPICGQPLTIGLAKGRKSGKYFVMLLCSKDGRHFRGFINHRPYVKEILERLEASQIRSGGSE